ncbi:endonuclease domain-containing protein [Tepidibacillus sp. LV47]|uniref:endonuclease domain-containing protein n=1 Tax=Tepidibacillus sp. LV47 TaxID=3398228 RepID=UPI003AAF9142
MGDLIGAGILIIGTVLSFVFFLTRSKDNNNEVAIDGERLKTESPIERRLYDALTSRGHYIVTQYPMGKYRIDIALPQNKIAIECDGHQFHSSKEAKERDKRKDKFLRSKGWKVIRIPGWMIYKSLPRVIRIIEDEIKDEALV